jgi:hypothetical protein
MASKTIAFGAIDQTAEPLCAKIAPTEPAISIGFQSMRLFRQRFKKENSPKRIFFFESLPQEAHTVSAVSRSVEIWPIQPLETEERLFAWSRILPAAGWSNGHPASE